MAVLLSYLEIFEKEITNELTAKIGLDLIRSQPAKRRMRPCRSP